MESAKSPNSALKALPSVARTLRYAQRRLALRYVLGATGWN